MTQVQIYSIIKNPYGTFGCVNMGTNLPLFEDRISWKSLSELNSDWILVSNNLAFEISKSEGFRKKVNETWEQFLLTNQEKTFTYNIEINFTDNHQV